MFYLVLTLVTVIVGILPQFSLVIPLHILLEWPWQWLESWVTLGTSSCLFLAIKFSGASVSLLLEPFDCFFDVLERKKRLSHFTLSVWLCDIVIPREDGAPSLTDDYESHVFPTSDWSIVWTTEYLSLSGKKCLDYCCWKVEAKNDILRKFEYYFINETSSFSKKKRHQNGAKPVHEGLSKQAYIKGKLPILEK